jgi:hypothetical protein
VFDSEEELARFLQHVYDQFDGRGFELTNLPVPASLRVSPWLLEQTQGQFRMHSVSSEDVTEAEQKRQGRRPFEPGSLKNLHPPKALRSSKRP